jgi:hypothetical protein
MAMDHDTGSPDNHTPSAAEGVSASQPTGTPAASNNQGGTQPSVSAGNITDNTGNTAVGSGINQNYANRDQFSGVGTVNIYYDSNGNPKTSTSGGGPSSETPQSSSGQQGGASLATPLNIIGLNNVMRRSLDESSMIVLCQTIAASSQYCSDLDYNGLMGSGWMNKTLSLIDYCRRRRAIALLIDTINDIRRNAMLNPTYQDWYSWAVGEDAK